MLPSVCFNWKGFTSAHLVEFKKELNSAVLKDMRSNKDNISVTVLAVDITRKESEYKWRLKFIIKWKKQKNRESVKKSTNADVYCDQGLEPCWIATFSNALTYVNFYTLLLCVTILYDYKTKWCSFEMKTSLIPLFVFVFVSFSQACMVTMGNALSISCE